MGEEERGPKSGGFGLKKLLVRKEKKDRKERMYFLSGSSGERFFCLDE